MTKASIKLYIFPGKKILKKIYVPTLTKIFRPVTQNTLIFYMALPWRPQLHWLPVVVYHRSVVYPGDKREIIELSMHVKMIINHILVNSLNAG